MHTLTKKTITAGIIMLGLALAIGCNETPTQTPDSLYELNGLVVIDPNLEGTMVSRSLRTAAHVYRNDEL